MRAGVSASPGSSLVALGLRLWGVDAGAAVRLQRRRERPLRAAGDRAVRPRPGTRGYFVNPSAYTYLLHIVFAVRSAGARACRTRSRATRRRCGSWPASARAVLGTIAVWLLYLAGTRLAGRRPGCSPPRCWPSRSCRSSTATWRSTTSRRSRRLPGAVGRGGRPADGPRARLRSSRGSASAWRRRRSTRAGIVLLALLAASQRRTRRATAAPRLRGLLLARRHRARGVPRRVPLRDHRPPRVPRRAEPPVRRLPRGGRQARLHAGQRLALLPLVVRLGAGLGAPRRGRRRAPAAGVPAPMGRSWRFLAPGADPLRRLHGLAGALLRALAHAGAPVRLPARRDLRRDAA